MNKKEKIKALKEALPTFWNSYQHMYDVRDRNGQTMVNFLLVLATFLPVLSISLYTTSLFNDYLILLPIIIEISAIVILLKSFAHGTSNVHWFFLNKELLKQIEKEEFEIKLIAELKSIEGETCARMIEIGKIIKISRFLIIFSLFGLLTSALFILFNGVVILYFLILILVALFSYIILYYYKTKPFDYKNGYEEAYKLLKEWINNKNEKPN